ncbi:transcriptional regulator MntR [Paenibacillus sp. LHD-38]|uniref:transcriptional regulator MntR n=1 Tax=Paenibacillus sp. LHD-38 TaxID=3072143 RepID=UPI00280D41E9|nr:transcriptional regulator MntR [Paenibacillus sp. LHD-38]MDQ8739120.1 transcriptional regulator MntR [Paenibacillus sp. LHD-38]
MPTPSMEDHLERIYLLIEQKGYARVMDIASDLTLSPSSVTRMIQKLGDQGFVNYVKYRGITLTPKGTTVAQTMSKKHQILEEFLELIGVPEKHILGEVDGIEHHISLNTVMYMSNWILFIKQHPSIQDSFSLFSSERLISN